MSGSGRSASTFARGSAHAETSGPGQSRPSEHSANQYEGFFKGLGTSSREPVCGKRNTSLKRLHDATHFAVGCKKWEEGGGAVSTAQASFLDPQVIYAPCDAPDKNASAVELRQSRFEPATHYRSEQREHFQHPGAHRRDPPYRAEVTVHLGDDRPELITQTKMAHGRLSPEDAERAAAWRAAGTGCLVPTSVWPKPVRCDPVTGGLRKIDNYDLGVASGMQFGRLSQNTSAIVWEANVRNPVLGHHIALEEHGARKGPGGPPPSSHVVAQANASVPPLRSLGALRPAY